MDVSGTELQQRWLVSEYLWTPDTPYRFVGAQRRRLKAPTDMFNVLYVQGQAIAAKDLYMSSDICSQ